MSAAPLVGVTTYGFIRNDGGRAHAVRETYTTAMHLAGAIPVLIPNDLGEDALRGMYERLDGILLSGGGDVAPHYFGAPSNELCTDIDENRDATEMHLVRWAHADDKPLLAICRGIQMLNVALGGTLVIDIPSQVGGTVPHHFDHTPGANRQSLLHGVQIEDGTVLREVAGREQIQVNSIHHQAIDRLAPPLRVAACAPDGIIESVEAEGARFFVGVQWHPEELYTVTPETPELFRRFAAAL